MKRLSGLALTTGFMLLFQPGSASAVEVPMPLPPLDPGSEEILPPDADFTAKCLSAFIRADRQFGAPVLTRSARWGRILRVDFKREGDPASSLVNRAMCWRGADGTWALLLAEEQDTSPLRDPPGEVSPSSPTSYPPE